jgi:flagellar protein FliS
VITHTSPHGAQAYYRTQVQSRSPVELIVMLYDGAIRFLRETEEAMAKGDRLAKARALSRALAILAELQNSLNMDAGGEVAERLDGLYTYMMGRLIDANVTGAVEPVSECLKLLDTVRSAWAELAARPMVAA